MTKTYPGHINLIKGKLLSLERSIVVLPKSPVAKPPGRKRARTSIAKHKNEQETLESNIPETDRNENALAQGIIADTTDTILSTAKHETNLETLEGNISHTDGNEDELMQGVIADTFDGTISNDKQIVVQARGDEVNGVDTESQEYDQGQDSSKTENVSLWVDAISISSGDTDPENRGRPENSWASEQCLRKRPRPEISTVDLSKEYNSSHTPISLSDSTPHTPQVTAWDDQSGTRMSNWLRQTNVPDLLKVAQQLPDSATFSLPRNMRGLSIHAGKTWIVEILTQLQPRKWLTGDLIGYFLGRIATDNNVQLLDNDWYSFDEPDLGKRAAELVLDPEIRTLIPCSYGGHWSCVEVDQGAGTITHYDSLLGGPGAHCRGTGGWVKRAGCVHCKRVGDIFSHASASVAQGGWDFLTPYCQQQENEDDCGVFMLSILQDRARKLKLDGKISPNLCRFAMAMRLVRDILTSKSREDTVQMMSSDIKKVPFEFVKESTSPDDENTGSQDTDVEHEWTQFEQAHQCGGWVSQLIQIAKKQHGNGLVGLKRSSRLLQLVANIASPLTLVEVKRQLAELRRHRPQPGVSSNYLQGAYVAGVWHESNKWRSSMCVRLISWVFRNEVLQRMEKEGGKSDRKRKADMMRDQGNQKREYRTAKKNAIDCLVGDIYSQDWEISRDGVPTTHPPTPPPMIDEKSTTTNVDEITEDGVRSRINRWYQMGGSWFRLADAAGSPACVCLLPSGTNILPGQPQIYASEYRDLQLWEVETLGTLFSELRPRMNVFFSTELCQAFLKCCPPSRSFQLESWSDEWICSQRLDSDDLIQAFGLQ